MLSSTGYHNKQTVVSNELAENVFARNYYRWQLTSCIKIFIGVKYYASNVGNYCLITDSPNYYYY